ncbi:MAG: conjugal transfer protein TraF [Armatimonadetes bacterium]|nr:conjugal transfer protein TraF [Armatimonadota bacterium]MCX7969647.1 conjugal transfer protein TraF [Armatimonadota bacterium]MDW8144163.1 conjugal transfer protein TraF [Armatimonadota bacterium]
MRWSVVGWVLVLLSGIAAVGFGQQVGPKFLDRSFQRPGARALGMGGAYLLATDDATAVAWNPAALVNAKRFTLPIEISGRTNFDVQDVKDLADALKDIRDQINVAPNLQLLAKAVKEVRSSALDKGAVAGGAPTTLRGIIAPVAGLTFGSYGIAFSSGAFTQVQIFVDQNTDPDPYDNIPLSTQPTNVYTRGGGIAVSNLALAHARQFPAGLTLGLSVRGVRADFQGYAASAGVDDLTSPTDGDSLGVAFARVHKTKFTLDLGALWEPPVQPPVLKTRFAAVIRNVLPVKFNLPAKDLDGNPVSGFDFSFRLNPEIDLGVLAEWRGRTIGVLELHNVTSSNGGDMTVHAGIEHWLAGNVFAIRLGYDDDKPVFGLGINLKALRIDLAAGFKPKERAAIGISLRF